MNWRPDRWEDAKMEIVNSFGEQVMMEIRDMDQEYRETFEAGADAILGALEEKARGRPVQFVISDKAILVYL